MPTYDMWREIDHASRPSSTQLYINGWVALIINVFFVVTMDEIGAMVQKVSGSRGLMKTTK
jgi:hypothetical protein